VCSDATAERVWVRWSKTRRGRIPGRRPAARRSGRARAAGPWARRSRRRRTTARRPLRRGSAGCLLGQDAPLRQEGAQGHERIGGGAGLGRQVGRVGVHADRPGLDRGLPVADGQQAPWADAHEGVAAEPLAALDGFEQEGRASVVEAHEGTDRGFEVRAAGSRQQDRVGRAGQPPDLAKTERIFERHLLCGASGYRACPSVRRASQARRRIAWESKRPSSLGRKVEPSAVPPAFGNCRSCGRRVGLSRGSCRVRLPPIGGCPLSLALCAGAYCRALEARGLVRRLTGPFTPSAAPACTTRWFSTPAPGVTRPDHSPYFECGPESTGRTGGGCQTEGRRVDGRGWGGIAARPVLVEFHVV